MISFEMAQSLIEFSAAKNFKPGIERRPLCKAIGSIVATDVLAPESLPAFDNSAMDGFAVCSSCTEHASAENRVRLKVTATHYAGEVLKVAPHQDAALEIMTGASMPGAPFDAVVRYEDCERVNSAQGSEIFVSRRVVAGENVRRAGIDVEKGLPVLIRGERLSAQHVLRCAALGISHVEVFRRPRVALFATGDEVVDYRTASLLPSQIRNSSAPMLEVLASELNIELESFGIIEDSAASLRAMVSKLVNLGFDAILSTGSVSEGKRDFLPTVLAGLGAITVFHKVALRPGKPLLFAELKSHDERTVAFFGLPGNPLSSVVGFRFFVTSYFRQIEEAAERDFLLAKARSDFAKPERLTCVFLGNIANVDDKLVAELAPSQQSHRTSTLAASNCWVLLPEGEVKKGDLVRCFPVSRWV